LAFVVHEVQLGASFIDRAIELNPNLPVAWDCSAWIKVFARVGEIVERIKDLLGVPADSL
jgi:hypothetical protein